MGSADSTSAELATAHSEAMLGRLPPRLRRPVARALARWPGRIVLRTASTCIRIEVFDRSMTIAAQFFTSVFPILILMTIWMSERDSDAIADAMSMPEQSRSVLEEAAEGTAHATFGVIGTLIVLASATSLARALARAFAAVWDLPRPKSRLRSAWRWLAVVLGMALELVVVQALSGYAAAIPPRNAWQVVVWLTCDLTVAVFVPWILLGAVVPLRRLVPGALLFALVMVAIRPASAVWLPWALEVSADRYGSIGVAFTYLAWLYIVSFGFLVTAVVGQVVATDRGKIDAWMSGAHSGEVIRNA